jgi:hypothetical protein
MTMEQYPSLFEPPAALPCSERSYIRTLTYVKKAKRFDVSGADIDELDCAYAPGAHALLRLTQSRDVLIRGCRPQAAGGVFLRLTGSETSGIALVGNDLRGVGKAREFADGAAPSGLRSAGKASLHRELKCSPPFHYSGLCQKSPWEEEPP